MAPVQAHQWGGEGKSPYLIWTCGTAEWSSPNQDGGERDAAQPDLDAQEWVLTLILRLDPAVWSFHCSLGPGAPWARCLGSVD